MLVGVHDHIELWDRPRWEAYLAARSTHYDEIAERAFAGLKPRRLPVLRPNHLTLAMQVSLSSRSRPSERVR